jgi:3-dehydroquinate dehydratase II
MSELLASVRTGSRRWRIGMINGPNLPNLGRREKARFGDVGSLAELEDRVRRLTEALGVELRSTVASNHEGAILAWLHTQTDDLDALLVNPGGLTWTGEAARQAVLETGLPAVEVHFAKPHGSSGRSSIFGDVVVGTCQGLRKHSYTAGLVALVAMLDDGDFLRPGMYSERGRG